MKKKVTEVIIKAQINCEDGTRYAKAINVAPSALIKGGGWEVLVETFEAVKDGYFDPETRGKNSG